MADETTTQAAAPAPKPAAPAPALPQIIVSSSPHFHTRATVTSIMLWVIVAMLPAIIAGCCFFGLGAVKVLAVTTIAAVAFEFISAKIMKRSNELSDLSAVVTGLLLAMNLPSSTPWWICVVGAFMAIVVGKMIYGGLGCNPFNPALVGRVALLLAFPAVMTTWPVPKFSGTEVAPPAVVAVVAAVTDGDEAVAETFQVELPQSGATLPVTGATPLMHSKSARLNNTAKALMVSANPAGSERALTYVDLLIGRGKGGSLGETCSLALLAGGLLLIFLNIIRWRVPLCFIGTVAIITGIAWLADPTSYAPPTYHILTGGLMLGAFFMATDMVTTPLSRLGSAIFAIGCGIITSCIRLWGNYPEGVSFAILIMNAFTPLIDRYTAGKPFGMPKKKGLKFA